MTVTKHAYTKYPIFTCHYWNMVILMVTHYWKMVILMVTQYRKIMVKSDPPFPRKSKTLQTTSILSSTSSWFVYFQISDLADFFFKIQYAPVSKSTWSTTLGVKRTTYSHKHDATTNFRHQRPAKPRKIDFKIFSGSFFTPINEMGLLGVALCG